MRTHAFMMPKRVAGRVSLLTGLTITLSLAPTACKKQPELKTDVKTVAVRPILRVAQLPISYSAVTYLAEAKGYFKGEGLDYQSISVPAGPDVVSALKGSGGASADGGMIAITPVITMIGAGADPVVLATTLTSNRQAKLVTFSRTGITEAPASLRGKRIGVTRNTNGDIYLSRLLRKGKLTPKDVTLVNGRPSDLRGLLLRGSLDAAVLWDPFVIQSEREYRAQAVAGKVQNRGEPRVFVDPTLHTLAFNIVSTRSKLLRNREAWTKMLRATIRAEEYIRQHPKEAQTTLEKWLKLQPGDLGDFFATTEFRVGLNVPQVKKWMREELKWLRENRPDAKNPADLSAYLDPSLLSAIDPKRVVR